MYKAKLPLSLLLLAFLATGTATGAEEIRDLPIEVDAQSGHYDAERGATHLQGDVRIVRGALVVRADEGFLYQDDDRMRRVELTGNPANWIMTHEDGRQTEGWSQQITYSVAGNRVTMTGEARVEDERGSFSGDRLVYDIDSQHTEGEGGIRMILEPEAAENRPD